MIFSLFIVIQLCFSPTTTSNCSQLGLARNCFTNTLSEQDLSDFLIKTANNECITILAYRASLSMRQAEFVINPYKKWAFFKLGRNQLEEIIQNNPENVEIRFIRYLTQSNIPSFLGYSDQLETDKKYIKNKLPSSSISKDFQQTILNHLE